MNIPEPERQAPALTHLCETNLDNLMIEEDAVIRQLYNLNTKKAPDPDGISLLLKHCDGKLTQLLTLLLIFRQGLRSGSWPGLWKEAHHTC